MIRPVSNSTTSTPSGPARQEGWQLRLREGWLIGLSATFLYLVTALLTYSPDDPGWSDTGLDGTVHNAGGPAGAWLADVFLTLFGYMAYLFPLMLGYRAWMMFRHRRLQRELDWPVLGVRLIGLILVMLAATGLAAMELSGSNLPTGPGGVLGEAIGRAATSGFSVFGGRVLLSALLLFGITIFTDLSWLRLIDALGAAVLAAWAGLHRWLAAQRERRSARSSSAPPSRPAKRAEPAIRPRVSERPAEPGRLPPPAPTPEPPAPALPAAPVGERPALELLEAPGCENRLSYSEEELTVLSRLLEEKLADFGIAAEVVEVLPGPVITRFEIQPAPGVKVSRISNLVKDLARSLAVISVRVVEVIPGKSVVGIEIPNEDRAVVNFRDVMASQVYADSRSPVTLALGHDIAGEPVVADLVRMPHLLVAGTTGSGKSVGINAMLLSILYKSGPEEVRLLLVDPKMLELSVYEGIPHLLTPVITDMKDAASGLRWCVAEMERRYRLMAALGVRNLAGFNRKVKEAIAAGEPLVDPLWQPDEHYQAGEEHARPPDLEPLPIIVVVVDEFADMMMIVGKKVEELIARIAQKARAAGIHLILATQRPSVDVITGLIKANVPTRIAFQVSSKVDSRTILDQGGAEQLLGHGDMLYMPPGSGVPVRVHGAFVSDDEVHRVAEDWRSRGGPNYIDGLLEEGLAEDGVPGLAEGGGSGEEDELYDQAVRIVTESRRASISSVQRRLRIGYNRAARLIESMELAGVVSEMSSNGSREVLAPPPVQD